MKLASFTRGIVLACLSAIVPLTARAQATGSIVGQVSNQVTKSYLEGATVELDGTGRSTTTDREGRFEFRDVPPGPATVVVAFAGLDTSRTTVTAASGRRVVQDVELTSGIYRMDKFTVAGEREVVIRMAASPAGPAERGGVIRPAGTSAATPGALDEQPKAPK